MAADSNDTCTPWFVISWSRNCTGRPCAATGRRHFPYGLLELLVNISFGRVKINFVLTLYVNIHVKDILDRGFKVGDGDAVGIDAGESNVILMLLVYCSSNALSVFEGRRNWDVHGFGDCYN